MLGHHFTSRQAWSHGFCCIQPCFRKNPTKPAFFQTDRSAFVRVISRSPQIRIQSPSCDSARIQSMSGVLGGNFSLKCNAECPSAFARALIAAERCGDSWLSKKNFKQQVTSRKPLPREQPGASRRTNEPPHRTTAMCYRRWQALPSERLPPLKLAAQIVASGLLQLGGVCQEATIFQHPTHQLPT